MFSRLLKLGLPRDRGFVLGLALATLEAVAAIALLACSAWLISAAAEQPPIMYLNMAIVGVRGFALGRAFFRYTQRLTLHDSAFRLQTQLRPLIIRGITPFVPAGLKSLSRGDVSSQLVTDVEEIQNLGVRTIAPVVQAVVAGLATVIALAIISPSTSSWLVLLVCLIGSALLTLPVSVRWNQAQVSAAALHRNQLQSQVVDYLENLETLLAFEWDANRRVKLSALDLALTKSQSAFALTAGFGSGVFSLFSTITVCLLAFTSAEAVQAGQLDHRFVAVVAMIPIAVFEVWAQLQSAVLSLQKYHRSTLRVYNTIIATVPAEIMTSSGANQLDVITSIELKDVMVSYPEGDQIGPYSMRLSLGDSLVIRGASGTGKTTLAYCLSGFLKPQSGQYLINGQLYDDFLDSSLRGRIGYLEQSPTIFDGTVRTNLQIGKPQATDDELWRSLEQVGLASVFRARQGLDTQMGERGNAVSGGEAQRISLARALLADFQVLIFDEPTANVDKELAKKLWDDLHALTVNDPSRITIFITHDSDLPSYGASTLTL